VSTTTAPVAGEKRLTSTGIPRGRIIVIFVGLLLGILMSALDQTIVSTALPHIASDLSGFQQITWIITAYLLAQTIVMPVYGKVGDFIGRKRAFQLAIVIFLAGSVVAGLSQSMGMLIAMRAVQGVGAGGLMIGAQTIIAEIVSARERGKYMSIMGPMIGVATVLGPLLGGFLTTSVSWRWIFYINVPIGIAALVVTAVVLKLPDRRHRPKVDFWGITFIGGAAASLVLLLTWGGRQYAWDSPTIIGLMIAAAVLVVGFVWAERRAAEPIMPLRLFRDNAFRMNSILAFLIGLALFGAVSYLPTYLQISLGATATMSGILMLPLMGGLMLAAITTGQLMTRTGRYKIFPIVGAALGSVGMYLLSLMGADTPRGVSSIYMIVLGLGIGFIMPTLVLTVQNSVSQKDMGSATAGVNFFRQIGGSFGTAIIGSLFIGRLTTNLSQNLPASFAAKLGDHAQGVTTNVLEKFPPQIAHDYVVSYADALTPLYAYLAPVILVGFVLAWFIKEKPLASAQSAGAPAEEPARPAQDRSAVDGGAPSTGRTETSSTLVRVLNSLHARSGGERAGDGDAGWRGPDASADGQPAVAGNVYRADRSAAQARVALLDLGGKRLEGSHTASDGSYRLTLPGPGTYLLAVLPTRDRGERPVAELVTADGDAVWRNVHLAEAGT
jgi:EmrB/QacA subfamily drug resistance transporter